MTVPNCHRYELDSSQQDFCGQVFTAHTVTHNFVGTYRFCLYLKARSHSRIDLRKPAPSIATGTYHRYTARCPATSPTSACYRFRWGYLPTESAVNGDGIAGRAFVAKDLARSTRRICTSHRALYALPDSALKGRLKAPIRVRAFRCVSGRAIKAGSPLARRNENDPCRLDNGESPPPFWRGFSGRGI